MKSGYYRLTADVKNPKPDKRTKRMDGRAVWPAGTVVYIKNRADQRRKEVETLAGERLPDDLEIRPQGEIKFSDSYVQFNLDVNAEDARRYPEWYAGNEILSHVEPAPKTLGQVLAQADWTPDDLLGLLIDTGRLTVEDVEAVSKHDLCPELDGNDLKRDDISNQFRKRHGLS